MICLQDLIDKCTDKNIHLFKEIYSAPLIISHPCKIYGNGAVIICSADKTISIESGGVELYDLNIEFESRPKINAPVISCKEDTLFHNAAVKGGINYCSGFSDDSEIPPVLKLGLFRADAENAFQFEFSVTENCTIDSDASGFTVSPLQLKQGKNIVTITTDKIRNGMIIYSEIRLIGKAVRKTVVYGISSANTDVHTISDSPLTQQDDSLTSAHNPPTDALPPDCPDNKYESLQKGQRVNLNEAKEIRVQLAYGSAEKKLDIDSYTFLLNSTGKVSKEQDLIFWGNKCSDDKSVNLSGTDESNYVSVMTEKLSGLVNKVVICYSIYGDDPDETFRYLHNPYIRIFADGVEKYRFILKNLNNEKTIAAIEIYSHNEKWKMNCVGSGYRDGLKRMCEDYGIKVAD